mmetsp:Transcript_37226/g.90420  ORF Transcript_37226/g.90420 Transcript_37226/m.90420 type:complete len:329 (+) Transcript_37226:51-1037(+)
MGSLLLLRLFYALFVIFVVANPKCSGFSSPLAAASRHRIRQQNSEAKWNIRCGSMPKETMESPPPRTSQSPTFITQNSTVVTEPKRSYSWIDRVYQLQEYKETYGDTCVPKRFPNNPSLGNWVNKQRVQYRKFLANETPCSMTEEKVAILNQVGFCWDGTAPKSWSSQMQDREDKWWSRLEEFRNIRESTDQKKTSPAVGRWLRQQRWLLQQQAECGRFDEKKLKALNAIDPNWWKSVRQIQWEERYQELIVYKKEHGNCCVPISYAKNKKLANWVSNCRKQYRLREEGEANNMSQERIDELNAIGFVWDRWEYEFEQKAKLGDDTIF